MTVKFFVIMVAVSRLVVAEMLQPVAGNAKA